MTAKHTPGPWTADEWATGYTVSSDLEHYSVCHLEGCNNAEANARLIAAAPELLAALEAFIGLPFPMPGQKSSNRGWSDFQAYCDQARAAIAKAKGGAA